MTGQSGRHGTALLTGSFDKALYYASALHRTLQRAGLTVCPFPVSLLAASLVIEEGRSEPEAIAALLLNISMPTLEEILVMEVSNLFGKDTATILRNCLQSNYRNSSARYAVSNRRLLAAQLPGSLAVALADCVARAAALHVGMMNEAPPERSNHRGELEHFDLLTDAFEDLYPGALVKRLSLLVAEMTAISSPYVGSQH